MALSMEEQRILAQIEEHLAGHDPDLAARLSSFGAAGAGRPPQLPRVRLAGPAAALVALAIVAMVVYALIPFRALPDSGGATSRPSGGANRVMMTARHMPKTPAPHSASPAAAPQHTRLR